MAFKLGMQFSFIHSTVSVLLIQSRPTLCDPMDCRLPGSSIHGTLQVRILEWVVMLFSRGIFLTQESNPGLLHCIWILLPSELPGKPPVVKLFIINSVFLPVVLTASCVKILCISVIFSGCPKLFHLSFYSCPNSIHF